MSLLSKILLERVEKLECDLAVMVQDRNVWQQKAVDLEAVAARWHDRIVDLEGEVDRLTNENQRLLKLVDFMDEQLKPEA